MFYRNPGESRDPPIRRRSGRTIGPGFRRDCDGGSSRSERSQSEDAVDRVEAGENAAADQVLQGFGRAAAQGAVACAAIEARYRELVGEAVAAMHLNGVAGDPEH